MMRTKNKKYNLRAFTLIELLTVIAVIGLLSTIAVASFSDSRDKARIAKGLQFSDTLRAALQIDTLGYWTFNETSGTQAKDGSGFLNHGTLPNGGTWVPGIVNNALQLNGTNQYVSVLDNASLQQAINAITIEMWVKPDSMPFSPSLIKKTASFGFTAWSNDLGFVARINGIDRWVSRVSR